jgi:aryl-alcohol dehydrogenase-like predicted oxidoreductase
VEYVQLGRSSLNVSRIGFGCEQLGGNDWGHVDEADAIAAVRTALDHGVNFFDTADVYGLGHSEETLSKALGDQRSEVIVATKFGVNWRQDAEGTRATTYRDCSPKRVVEALEASLRRLRLDRIPLYQIHWPDPSTALSDTLEALARCQKEGKIRYIGCSNFPEDLLREATQSQQVISLQIPYNLLDRGAEKAILPLCQDRQIGVLAYGPLAQGLLSGKYGPDSKFDTGDRRSRLPTFRREVVDQNLPLIEKLREVAQGYEKTPAQVALRWLLDSDSISCAITGVKEPRQIEENAGALGWSLGQEDWDYLAS